MGLHGMHYSYGFMSIELCGGLQFGRLYKIYHEVILKEYKKIGIILYNLSKELSLYFNYCYFF